MYEIGKDIYRFGGRVARRRDLERSRLRVVYGFIYLLFIVFFAKTLYYGCIGTDKTGKAKIGGDWVITRADIEDRNGVKLAKNVVSGHIMVRPGAVKDVDAVAQKIHEVFPYKYSVAQAYDILKAKKFMYLKQYATDAERKQINEAKLDGLEVEVQQMRRYPKHNLFAHVVGFVGKEGDGLEGAERIFDSYLRENTDPLRLSLDTRIQEQFHTRLSEAVQKYHAKGAMGMLMNSRTGEMLAMVSLPDFDPEHVSDYPVANRRFKQLRDVLEMGSVFKIFNTALAYENGIRGKYYVEKPYILRTKSGKYVHTFHDVSKFDKKWMDVDEIMVHSCNVGSVQIALQFPEGAQPEFLHKLHLDEKLDLDFGKTEHPIFPKKKWNITDVASVSFGHTVAVTPIHLLLGVNAVTNGGIYINPTIKKRDVGRIQGTRVLSEEISAKLRENMVRVVEETSGKLTRINGIKIGGKTGTAEKRINGVIDKKRNMTTFVGIFPAEAPQYIIMVNLDEPQGLAETGGWRTASQNSVPTAGKILDGILPLLFE